MFHTLDPVYSVHTPWMQNPISISTNDYGNLTGALYRFMDSCDCSTIDITKVYEEEAPNHNMKLKSCESWHLEDLMTKPIKWKWAHRESGLLRAKVCKTNTWTSNSQEIVSKSAEKYTELSLGASPHPILLHTWSPHDSLQTTKACPQRSCFASGSIIQAIKSFNLVFNKRRRKKINVGFRGPLWIPVRSPYIDHGYRPSIWCSVFLSKDGLHIKFTYIIKEEVLNRDY